MIESRCGALCAECAYRERVGCTGCIQIQKPFWGDDCPVKSCCEEKSKEHCGQCEQFPCEQLKEFVEQGDDHKRIERCMKWRDKPV